MNLLRACLDWRVLGGLTVLGLAVYLVAPGLILGVPPVLLVAVCPLSMLLMMRSMGGGPADTHVPPRSAGGNREAALRGELAELARRQEQLNAEVPELEASRQGGASQFGASAPLEGR